MASALDPVDLLLLRFAQLFDFLANIAEINMISHMALRQFPFVRCSGSFLCMQADRLCTGHYAQYRPSAFSKQPISDRKKQSSLINL